MKILVSNDDGIYATGLKVLSQLLKDLSHEVHVIAPQLPQSGMSNAITLHTALITKKIYFEGKFFGMSVEGYPSDCVRLGLLEFHPDVDVVVTGINLGLNAGPAIYYSGTVAGAFEAGFAQRRAFAFSLNSFRESEMEKQYEKFSPFLPILLEKCNLPILYNVNIPAVPEIKGIKVTRQARNAFLDHYEKRLDPRDREYYWVKFRGWGEELFPPRDEEYPHDLDALNEGYISVTPLQFDLTSYEHLFDLRRDLIEFHQTRNAKKT